MKEIKYFFSSVKIKNIEKKVNREISYTERGYNFYKEVSLFSSLINYNDN
jgi:hypothetical protein